MAEHMRTRDGDTEQIPLVYDVTEAPHPVKLSKKLTDRRETIISFILFLLGFVLPMALLLWFHPEPKKTWVEGEQAHWEYKQDV